MERPRILAGGLLNNPRKAEAEAQLQAAEPQARPRILPGTIPTAQQLVSQILNPRVVNEPQKKLVVENAGTPASQELDGPSVTPKKERPRLTLDLNRGLALRGNAIEKKESDTGSSAKPRSSHRLGDGKISVRDIVNRITGKDRDVKPADANDKPAPANDDAPE
jgi:hypothetical protein